MIKENIESVSIIFENEDEHIRCVHCGFIIYDGYPCMDFDCINNELSYAVICEFCFNNFIYSCGHA